MSAVTDLTGFGNRWSCKEGLKDATYGWPYPGTPTNTGTAFNAPGRGGAAGDGWNTMAGTEGGAVASLIQPNGGGVGGGTMAYGGGYAFSEAPVAQIPISVSSGNWNSKTNPSGALIIGCVRHIYSPGVVSNGDDPTTINGSARPQLLFAGNGVATQDLYINTDYKGQLFGSHTRNASITTLSNLRLNAHRNIVVLKSKTGAGVGMQVGLYNETTGAVSYSTLAGTPVAGAATFLGLANDGNNTSGENCPMIWEDLCICNGGLETTESKIAAACAQILGEHQSYTFAPTILLDLIGDSITHGLGTVNGNNFANSMQRRLARLPLGRQVLVRNHGVSQVTALGWSVGGAANDFLLNKVQPYSVCASQYPTINKQIGLILLGANELGIGRTASVYIGHMEALADAYFSLYGTRPWVVVPLSRGDTDPGTREALRRQYRTALLSSSKFGGVIDTDTREPGRLVAEENSAASCAEVCGGLSFQQPTTAANAIALPGTLALNGRAIGSDAIHIGAFGHEVYANMVLSDTASGLAQTLGTMGSSSRYVPARGR